ncbi:MAG: hypothetical protein K9M82_02990, partial [Deltaproteobacteria bacterium]|nr:hypothetical protein [Deltaproteobacteria bacterium]
GSGSLLICCRPGEADPLVEAIRALEIPVRRIGEVLDREPGVEAAGGEGPRKLPSFEVDEITRLFGGEPGGEDNVPPGGMPGKNQGGY